MLADGFLDEPWWLSRAGCRGEAKHHKDSSRIRLELYMVDATAVMSNAEAKGVGI